MVALFALLTIITLSFIGVRIGGIALELTGLSPEIASFQAQSAFSGTGFTTTESEALVAHPVRRRIIRILILMGSAGITTSIATLVITFLGQSGKDVLERSTILLIGLVILSIVARSRYLYHIMKIVIAKALKRWTKMRVFDYEQLLGFSEGYAISRIAVKAHSWLKDKRLSELKLERHGLTVLAIYRKAGKKEKFMGGLTGETIINVGDILICYAPEEVSEAISNNTMLETERKT
ncbi:MAG: TrkA C-terminal domain-containing protein [Candidatus Omnitrophica bacterium]|nr:TrkA C-terminal domain-containing protein [Candidatus Omnitrophota bacterium]